MISSKAYQIARAALLAVMLCACGNDRLEEATARIKDGQLAEAERLLEEEQIERPGDLEVRMLLGEVYLRRQKPQEAAAMFEVFVQMPKYAPRVAEVYEAHIAGASGDPALFAHYLLQSARFNPARAQEHCQALLAETRHRRNDEVWEVLATTAAKVSENCRSKTAAMLTSWMLNDRDQRSRVAALVRELRAR